MSRSSKTRDHLLKRMIRFLDKFDKHMSWLGLALTAISLILRFIFDIQPTLWSVSMDVFGYSCFSFSIVKLLCLLYIKIYRYRDVIL